MAYETKKEREKGHTTLHLPHTTHYNHEQYVLTCVCVCNISWTRKEQATRISFCDAFVTALHDTKSFESSQ